MHELAIMQAMANLGNTITSMVATASQFKTGRKQEAVLVSEQIRFLRQQLRIAGIANLTRTSILEMEKTIALIASKNATGTTLDMYMSLLQMQYDLLEQNLRNYLC